MVLFTSRRNTPSGTQHRLETVPLSGGVRRVVLDGVEQAIFASADRIVYTRGNALFEADFDAAAGAVRGASTRLPESVYIGPIGGSAVTVSENGTLVLAPAGLVNGRLIWVSPAGVERPISGPTRGFQNPRVSPDGRRIAFSEAGTIWTLDHERGTFTRVSAGTEPSVGFPVWSQDSKRIYYRSIEGIRVRSADGEGQTERLPNTVSSDYPASLTPDGVSLVFLRITAETAGDIYATPASGGEISPLLVTKAYEGGPQVSPDGKWLLYVSSESGRMEVCLRPLGGPDRKWTVSNGGGLHPLWSPDGRRAFYRSGQQFFEVDVTTSPDVRLGTPRALFERQYEFGPNLTFPNYSVSGDGREFLVVQGALGGRQLNLVLNWLQRPRG
jgi:Tol biopolymer transport system component